MIKVIYVCDTCKGELRTKTKKGKNRQLTVRCPACNKSTVLVNPKVQIVVNFGTNKEPK